MKRLLKNKKGMTGIETAIILIAFVIAASVFAFAVLNMGLISTQRAQEAVGAGLEQASSSLLLDTLVQKAGTGAGGSNPPTQPFAVDNITILVKIAPGQSPCDFNQTRMTISFKNNYTFIGNIYTMADGDFVPVYDESYSFSTPILPITAPALCAVMVLQGNANPVLEAGETFAIMVNLVGIQEQFGKSSRLRSYDQFLVDIVPSVGAKLSVMARTPVSVQPVMILLTGGPA